MITSQAQQSSQWISVEDRLPEMETPVVALVGKNVYALARVDYDEGWLWAICGCDLSDIRDYEADDDYQPTYWMPLAIPPAPEYQEPEHPLDTPLPCDIRIGAGTIKKGSKLSVLVARMNVLYQLAMKTQLGIGEPANQEPTKDE